VTVATAVPAAVREKTGTLDQPPVFADFHCHTRFSRDSRLGEDDLIRLAIARGLTHVAVTDHNTVDGSLAVRARVTELGLGDQLHVIPGEEVSSADGEIVALFITETVPRGLSAEETADAIHAQGGLVSVPHPFDPFRRSHIRADALERLAGSGRIDMIEVFNSRVTLGRHNEAAAEVAARHGIPGIAASDSHTGMEVAMSSNALAPFATASELRAALPTNQWTGSRTTKLVHLGTRWAVVSKWLGARLGAQG
jgi:predicted metal-dependent phosphoesterase TrpH